MISSIKTFALTIGILVSGIVVSAQQQLVDEAVTDAGAKTIIDMASNSQTTGIKSIAFLGLKNDSGYYSSVFRAALTNATKRFSFYNRGEKLWDRLVGEIEFGERREDVMNKATIKKFGKIEGVQALMIGKVLEAAVDDDNVARFRVSLSLVEVETGRFIWGGNITGFAQKTRIFKPVSKYINDAAIDAGKRINNDLSLLKAKLKDKYKKPFNVFIMPLQGEIGLSVYDSVSSELCRNFGNEMNFFGETSKVGKLYLGDLQSGVKDQMPTYSSKQLQVLMSRLERLYNINRDAVNNGIYGKDRINAYLYGIVTNTHIDTRMFSQKQMVSITIQIRDLKSNEVYWSANVTGESEIPVDVWECFKDWVENNTVWSIVIGSILGGIILIFLLFMAIRSMSRPR
jgi:Peptidoglycan-synthase activator LpoB